MPSVNVIGAGKVSRTLMSLTRDAVGFTLRDIASSREESARAAVTAVSGGRAVASFAGMRPADLWFLTVPDDAIAGVAHELAGVSTLARGEPGAPRPVADHCSGFLPSEALAPLRDLGWLTASCHPVRSFADPDLAARQFPGTLCGIEGDAAAVPRIEAFVSAIGGRPFAVTAEKKALWRSPSKHRNLCRDMVPSWNPSGYRPLRLRDHRREDRLPEPAESHRRREPRACRQRRRDPVLRNGSLTIGPAGTTRRVRPV